MASLVGGYNYLWRESAVLSEKLIVSRFLLCESRGWLLGLFFFWRVQKIKVVEDIKSRMWVEIKRSVEETSARFDRIRFVECNKSLPLSLEVLDFHP